MDIETTVRGTVVFCYKKFDIISDVLYNIFVNIILTNKNKGAYFMCAKDFRKAAWGKLSGNWGIAIGGTLLVAIVNALLSSTGIGWIVSGIVSVGGVAFMLELSREKKGNVETLLAGVKNGAVNNILAGILVSVFTLLWSVLFIIPGIIMSYAYSMTFYILADNPNMSATDAIKASKAMMTGNKWRYFCLQFSFIGWILLSVLTGGILMIWVTPYISMASAEFYESIKPQPAAEAVEAIAEETAQTTTENVTE